MIGVDYACGVEDAPLGAALQAVAPGIFRIHGDAGFQAVFSTSASPAAVLLPSTGSIPSPTTSPISIDTNNSPDWPFQTLRYGVVEIGTREVVPATYCRAHRFSEGLALLQECETEIYRYINEHGETVLQGSWLSAEPFRNGAARVRDADGFFLIDKEGRDVLDGARFPYLRAIPGGIFVPAGNRSWPLRLIRTDGTSVLDFDFRLPHAELERDVGSWTYERLMPGTSVPESNNFEDRIERGILFEDARVVPIPGARRVSPFIYDRAYVETDTHRGFVDADGDWIVRHAKE